MGEVMAELLSINEAAARGIERVRKTAWANSFDHVKIDIIDGKPGPWLHVFAPFNRECNGRDPVSILLEGPDDCCFVPYDGPLPTSEEYRAAAARYEGVLSKQCPATQDPADGR